MSSERWEKVEELFHDALEQPAEKRDGVLANADSEVAGEVRALLDAHDAATHTESPLVGKRVGDYRIVR